MELAFSCKLQGHVSDRAARVRQALAKRAIDADPRIGVIRPCNLIVRETARGKPEISAINPSAPMSAIGNAQLDLVARNAIERLSRVVAQM